MLTKNIVSKALLLRNGKFTVMHCFDCQRFYTSVNLKNYITKLAAPMAGTGIQEEDTNFYNLFALF